MKHCRKMKKKQRNTLVETTLYGCHGTIDMDNKFYFKKKIYKYVMAS